MGRIAGKLSPGLIAAAVLLLAAVSAGPLSADEQVWLRVDTGEMSLSVMQGTLVRQTFSNIAIGRGGATEAKRRRDGKTPLGEFRIVRMTTDTPFYRFFALDYPNLQHARRGRLAGIIGESEYAAIEQALRSNKVPPQDTALGGYIGIHGIGQGSPAVHEDFNWTFGCIALTNAQMEALSRWVHTGMRVVIQR